MEAAGAHLQVLARSLIDAIRAADDARAQAIGEELFDLGGRLVERDMRRGARGRRARMRHGLRTPAAMLVWRLRQMFRRRPV